MTAWSLENISSFEAIVNSIIWDINTCRWFEFLITEPQVMSELQSDAQTVAAYNKLKNIILRQRILLTAVLLCGAVSILAVNERWIIFFLAAGLLALLIRLQKLKTRCVTDISTRLICRSYTKDALSKITLYQLAEQYSRKYQIPSLVDKLFRVELILQHMFLGLALLMLITGIPSTLPAALLSFLLYYLLLKTGLMITAIYKRIV